MNFVDTAITLLQESGRAMAAQELCDLAIDRGLLDKPGKNPLRSMKTRLSVEFKKGKESRVLRDDDEAWMLSKPPAKKAKAKPAAKAKAKPAAKAKAKPAAKAKAKPAAKAKAKPAAKAKAKPAAKAKAKPAAKAKAKPAVKAKAKPAAKAKAKPAAKAKAKPAAKAKAKPVAKSDAAVKKNAEADTVEIKVTPPPVELTPEEKALVELYGDSQGTRSATELNEYSDSLTKDEDRPMLPEIRAERRPHRGRERTRRRRTRTDRPERSSRARSERPERSERSERSERKRSTTTTTTVPRDITGTAIVVVDADASPSSQLVAASYGILAALPAGQSMPIRQLTQTLIRKDHLKGHADSLWRMVKGTLLVSEQRRSTRGLVPLVQYLGKDLFSAKAAVGRSAVDVAEAALSQASENYATAVADEMQSRLADLAPQMLERIVYVYLQSTGWTDISWIKRVEKSSYGLATAPGAVEQTMIGVRSGPEDLDRRGVGELRAGLHAKNLNSGLLLSPCALSDEAKVELAKDGAHLRVLCGRDFLSDLIAREVGVTWRHQQLPQVDQRFWDALLS